MQTQEKPIKLSKINIKNIETKIWEKNLDKEPEKEEINIKNIDTKLWEREF